MDLRSMAQTHMNIQGQVNSAFMRHDAADYLHFKTKAHALVVKVAAELKCSTDEAVAKLRQASKGI